MEAIVMQGIHQGFDYDIITCLSVSEIKQIKDS